MDVFNDGAALVAEPQLRSARSTRATLLSLLIGTGGIMVTGIQPLLLGSLSARGVLSPSGLGLTGAVEIFGLAAGIVVGSRRLISSGSRRYIVAAALVMALANIATGSVSAEWQVILLRSLAGLAEGVLIAVIMLAITYSPRPERLGGLFLSVSGPPSLVLAYVLPSTLDPLWGWNAGFLVMAVIGVVCALAGSAYDGDLKVNGPSQDSRIVWHRPIILALAATLLANAAFGACWTYVEPLARLRGISSDQIGQIVTLAIGCQISGSAVIALSGRHFRALPFLKVAAVLQVCAILLLVTASHGLQFGIALGALSFCWQASAPCAIALITALDETRATAPLSFPLQLVGLSMGPLVAAFGASSSLSYPYVMALIMLCAAGALLILVGRSSRAIPDVRA